MQLADSSEVISAATLFLSVLAQWFQMALTMGTGYCDMFALQKVLPYGIRGTKSSTPRHSPVIARQT